MKKILKVFCVVLASAALTACDDEVALENGRIPAEYAGAVAPLMGAYGGIMENGEALSFEVVLEDQAVRAILIDDFLGGECAASLGTLKRVELREGEKEKLEVERAVFAFDPNRCADKVTGRELEIARIESSQGTKYEARVQAGTGRLFACEPTTSLSGSSPALRQSAVDCSWVSERDYLSGEIAKIEI